MPTTTTCPSCNGPLRIPDELVGQRVRCPVCQTIFDAAGASSAPPPEPAPAPESQPERPLWKDLSLELDKSDPGTPPSSPDSDPRPDLFPPQAPAPSPRLLGAVEVGSSGDEPPAPEPSRRGAPRDYPADGDDDHSRRSPYDRGPRRRDAEPHRGVLILVLGIISLVFTVFSMCYGLGILVGLPLGITAWVLGSGDLRKIKNREMDEEGLGITQAGWICGIIGTILHCLILLTCGAFVTFIILMQANSAPPKAPFGGPQPVMKP